MNKPKSVNTAKCPTCEGSGVRIRTWDHSYLGGKKGRKKQTCLSCRGTGKVEAFRVCPTCGGWLDVCRCTIEMKLKKKKRGSRTWVSTAE